MTLRGRGRTGAAVALVLVVLAVCVLPAVAVRFTMRLNHERCFREEIAPDMVVSGKFEFTPETELSNGAFRITDPTGNTIWTATEPAQRGAFALTTERAGDYHFCFKDTIVTRRGAGGERPNERDVIFSYKVGAEKESVELPKVEKLRPMEAELRRMEDVGKQITKDMRYMRRREERMRHTNESTESRVFWLSMLTMSTLIGLGTWQLVHLKRFFKDRQII